jgi:hypothetical protein
MEEEAAYPVTGNSSALSSKPLWLTQLREERVMGFDRRLEKGAEAVAITPVGWVGGEVARGVAASPVRAAMCHHRKFTAILASKAGFGPQRAMRPWSDLRGLPTPGGYGRW